MDIDIVSSESKSDGNSQHSPSPGLSLWKDFSLGPILVLRRFISLFILSLIHPPVGCDFLDVGGSKVGPRASGEAAHRVEVLKRRKKYSIMKHKLNEGNVASKDFFLLQMKEN